MLTANLLFVIINGYFAYTCFRDGNDSIGWLNVVASAFNAALILDRIM